MLLFKMKLTTIVVLTSALAYAIAAGAAFSWVGLLVLVAGGYFVTAAANTLNQVLERDYDKLMERTNDRPLATGRMSVSTAVLTAGMLSLMGVTLLSLFNPLTGLLGMISLILYAFVYTPLKRHSSVAVIIGAIPGAMPTLIGCVAFDGYISTLALVLFTIQFLWQFPHFWAIAQLSLDDYNKAGFGFIPNDAKQIDYSVKLQAFLSSILLIVLCVWSHYGLSLHSSITVILVVTSAIYAVSTYRFMKDSSRSNSLQLMFSSFAYMPLVLIVFLINNSLI